MSGGSTKNISIFENGAGTATASTILMFTLEMDIWNLSTGQGHKKVAHLVGQFIP